MQSHGQKRTPEGMFLCRRKVTVLVRMYLGSLVVLHNIIKHMILPLRLTVVGLWHGVALFPRGL
jgi:hypothetical protein